MTMRAHHRPVTEAMDDDMEEVESISLILTLLEDPH
jgi:hypothetical protein